MMKRTGFTLVELSIVLVIIGLLIGGILAAQSMISTAKIQSVVRQIGQYDTAISNFKTKYNQLPGDSNLFVNTGNNDGFIDYGEAQHAWSDLSLGVNLENSAGLNYQPYVATTSVISDAICPKLNLNQKSPSTSCLTIIATDLGFGTKNYYSYQRPSSGVIYTAGNADSFTVVDMLALDQKMDDGLPLSGKLLNGNSNCNDYGHSPVGYNLSITGYACIINGIELGIFNGGVGNN